MYYEWPYITIAPNSIWQLLSNFCGRMFHLLRCFSWDQKGRANLFQSVSLWQIVILSWWPPQLLFGTMLDYRQPQSFQFWQQRILLFHGERLFQTDDALECYTITKPTTWSLGITHLTCHHYSLGSGRHLQHGDLFSSCFSRDRCWNHIPYCHIGGIRNTKVNHIALTSPLRQPFITPLPSSVTNSDHFWSHWSWMVSSNLRLGVPSLDFPTPIHIHKPVVWLHGLLISPHPKKNPFVTGKQSVLNSSSLLDQKQEGALT